MMNRMSSFLGSYTIPVLVGITLGLLSGGVSLFDRFIHLQSDVEILKRDIKSIKGEDLPEIKEELRILHGLFHSVSLELKSKSLSSIHIDNCNVKKDGRLSIKLNGHKNIKPSNFIGSFLVLSSRVASAEAHALYILGQKKPFLPGGEPI